jgi:hypothetical protein
VEPIEYICHPAVINIDVATDEVAQETEADRTLPFHDSVRPNIDVLNWDASISPSLDAFRVSPRTNPARIKPLFLPKLDILQVSAWAEKRSSRAKHECRGSLIRNRPFSLS